MGIRITPESPYLMYFLAHASSIFNVTVMGPSTVVPSIPEISVLSIKGSVDSGYGTLIFSIPLEKGVNCGSVPSASAAVAAPKSSITARRKAGIRFFNMVILPFIDSF